MLANEIKIRECETVEELSECVKLQREVFALPEIEISPVRHLIVTKTRAVLHSARLAQNLVGFVLSVPAFLRGEKAFLFAYDRRAERFSKPRHRRKTKMGAKEARSFGKRQIYQMDFSARHGAKRIFQSRKTRRNRPPILTEFLRHGLSDFRNKTKT